MNKLTVSLLGLTWVVGVLLVAAGGTPAAVETLEVPPPPAAGDAVSTEDGEISAEQYVSPFDNLPTGVKAAPYAITGDSRDALRHAIIDSLTPPHGRNTEEHFGAATMSEYSFALAGEPVLTSHETRDSCRCVARDAVDVRLVVTVRYPEWVDVTSCEDERLVQDWRRYIADLYRHEIGHVYLARAGLHRLRRHLSSIEAHVMDTGCTGACARAVEIHHDLIQEAFAEITHEISQDQEGYDRRTDYGRSQGAAF
jgi:predicted secreted Zn-dependent protease